MSVGPSSWQVSTTSSAGPSTSRKWTNAMSSPSRRIVAGTSTPIAVTFP
jgi:hypothetical protein